LDISNITSWKVPADARTVAEQEMASKRKSANLDITEPEAAAAAVEGNPAWMRIGCLAFALIKSGQAPVHEIN
jgi:hypothetical protein